MQTIRTHEELWGKRQQQKGTVGLVPTMGYLHEGHLSLVRKAKEASDFVIVSIYVNPTQFAPSEDLTTYPRNIERDLELLEGAGADLVWLPDDEVMYPEGFQTWVMVDQVTRPLEGAQRPEHFQGVTTIVSKLFNAVQPQKAFFGQKDAQQAAVIQRMTRDLSYPIEIVVCPIVREPDGLAMSSRNIYLNEQQRPAAVVLNKAHTEAKAAYENGERSAEVLREIMKSRIEAEPLAKLQYVSCADPLTLQELEEVSEIGALLSMAVYFGKTRLIDNAVLLPNKE